MNINQELVSSFRKKYLDDMERHLKVCRGCVHMSGKTAERDIAFQTHCRPCTNLKKLERTRNLLLDLDRREHVFNAAEKFYIVNHLDVLGVERGSIQVAKRLGKEILHIEITYYSEKEKAKNPKLKTHHFAV